MGGGDDILNLVTTSVKEIAFNEICVYLSSIQLILCQTTQVFRPNLSRALGGSGHLDKSFPYLLFGLTTNSRECNHKVHTRDNGVVESGYPVGGQKQNGLAIFQFAKKDRHKTVAMDVLRRSLFYVRVCLVEQENGVPMACQSKYSSQTMLEVLSLGAKLCSRYLGLINILLPL